ncbi:hypothetical protein [Cupriavidus sp. YAF13]|uniref:hypothetical protein n=1 Tax=Cupriavidus sp. YAF13 TaxID=3233075 RepID=UPI003F8D9550
MKVTIERLETDTNFGAEIVLGLTSPTLFRWIERQRWGEDSTGQRNTLKAA